MQQYHSATLMIFSGVVNDDLDFNYGSESVYGSVHGGCAATLRGQMWYFGGYRTPRQVSL